MRCRPLPERPKPERCTSIWCSADRPRPTSSVLVPPRTRARHVVRGFAACPATIESAGLTPLRPPALVRRARTLSSPRRSWPLDDRFDLETEPLLVSMAPPHRSPAALSTCTVCPRCQLSSAARSPRLRGLPSGAPASQRGVTGATASAGRDDRGTGRAMRLSPPSELSHPRATPTTVATRNQV